MAMNEREHIEAAFRAGKVLVDIELPSGACSFDLTPSQCVELVEKLTQAALDAATPACEAR